MSSVYLDANATTPLAREVMAEMMPALADFFANPSSVHKPGQDARALVDAARERCARVLGCAAGEIVFTSGGTESDALAVLGGRPRKVVTTAVEHPAVLGACVSLAECVRLAVSASGALDLAALRAALPGASLCSVMAANNETGVISRSARSPRCAGRPACRCTSTPCRPPASCRSTSPGTCCP